MFYNYERLRCPFEMNLQKGFAVTKSSRQRMKEIENSTIDTILLTFIYLKP